MVEPSITFKMYQCSLCNLEYKGTADKGQTLCPVCIKKRRMEKMKQSIDKNNPKKAKTESDLSPELTTVPEERILEDAEEDLQKITQEQEVTLKNFRIPLIHKNQKFLLKSTIFDIKTMIEQQLSIYSNAANKHLQDLQKQSNTEPKTPQNQGKVSKLEFSSKAKDTDFDSLLSSITLLKIDLQSTFLYHSSILLQKIEALREELKVKVIDDDLHYLQVMLCKLNRHELRVFGANRLFFPAKY